MKVLTGLFFFAVALSAFGSDPQPVTVWNTFQEPGDNYYANGGASIFGTAAISPTLYAGAACEFIPSASGYLNNVSLAAGMINPATGGINVFVAANNNNLPGSILESFLNISCPPFNGNYYPPITLSSSLNPYLNQGVPYWLYVEPSTPASYGAWDYAIANPNSQYLVASESAPSTWNTPYHTTQPEAFDVTVVSTVPEPSTFVLALAGFLSCLLARRFRRATI